MKNIIVYSQISFIFLFFIACDTNIKKEVKRFTESKRTCECHFQEPIDNLTFDISTGTTHNPTTYQGTAKRDSIGLGFEVIRSGVSSSTHKNRKITGESTGEYGTRLRRLWENACDDYLTACQNTNYDNDTFSQKVESINEDYKQQRKTLDEHYFPTKPTVVKKEISHIPEHPCSTVSDFQLNNYHLQFNYQCPFLNDASIMLILETNPIYAEVITYLSFEAVRLDEGVINHLDYNLLDMDWNFSKSNLIIHIYVTEKGGNTIEVATVAITNPALKA